MSQNTSPLVTIPGTAVFHVLGTTATELGSGSLTLVASPVDESGAASKLTLTVGSAAFSLYEATTFGTVAGDERVYVFRPQLGDDIKGYVRIILPDGVREPHSEFQSLQARFERMLIEFGLLKPSEGPNERTITIPSVVATHVIADKFVELGRGDLTLSTLDASGKPGKDKRIVLTLRVGEAVFPLHRATVFGTLAENERTYVFSPEFGGSTGNGYVKLVFPENISTNEESKKLQEAFEQILIDYGLLKAGIEAVGDEIGRSTREDAAATANTIRRSKNELLAKNPPTTEPATFSPTTHTLADGSASATRSLYHAAHTVSTSISTAASSAGTWLSAQLGPASPGTSATLGTLADASGAAAGGLAAGTADISGAAAEAAGDVVQNELGPEARDLGERVAESVGSVSGAVGQVVGTGAAAAVAGVQGAVREDRRQEQDLGVFRIEEREESEEWSDVPG